MPRSGITIARLCAIVSPLRGFFWFPLLPEKSLQIPIVHVRIAPSAAYRDMDNGSNIINQVEMRFRVICRFRGSLAVLAVAACLFGQAATVEGSVYFQFTGIPGAINNQDNVDAAARQVYVEVFEGDRKNLGTEADPIWQEHVNFRFYNVGPAPSSITDVYFEDGTLLENEYSSKITVSDSALVSYSAGASPKNLPGGSVIGFNATGGFSADSDPPVQPNGVNNQAYPAAPLEWVNFDFGLINDKTFLKVLEDLELGTDGIIALRIGLHVQGFADGGSESLILDPQ